MLIGSKNIMIDPKKIPIDPKKIPINPQKDADRSLYTRYRS